ncbi:MGMT family protein [Brachybacterium sp. JHP9]|uniref:MGMT family protein n=1 Tax=Brachybacterium equifaecis TaxID=2910770 RepID=A0ABT0QXR4_9MICO|nr:MGMT family protein [Brachybacterium equifaecis]MCL6422451.1 MGMT family protein [Brachybacterium equifaecis]
MDPQPRVQMDDLTVERVLRTIEAIPRGRVTNYGTIGAIAGCGPRLVGRILRDWGSSVPWWRVVSASGEVAPPLRARAFALWEKEGISVAPHGRGCRMSDFRADEELLARDAEAAWVDLPSPPQSTGTSSRK